MYNVWTLFPWNPNTDGLGSRQMHTSQMTPTRWATTAPQWPSTEAPSSTTRTSTQTLNALQMAGFSLPAQQAPPTTRRRFPCLRQQALLRLLLRRRPLMPPAHAPSTWPRCKPAPATTRISSPSSSSSTTTTRPTSAIKPSAIPSPLASPSSSPIHTSSPPSFPTRWRLPASTKKITCSSHTGVCSGRVGIRRVQRRAVMGREERTDLWAESREPQCGQQHGLFFSLLKRAASFAAEVWAWRPWFFHVSTNVAYRAGFHSLSLSSFTQTALAACIIIRSSIRFEGEKQLER